MEGRGVSEAIAIQKKLNFALDCRALRCHCEQSVAIAMTNNALLQAVIKHYSLCEGLIYRFIFV